ncbi:MAG: 1-acyl-sn-glycerol-3-phosphate acyltransferase [Acidobacteria bacterium]|nr:1-acyl-sn-glycerol-3-phosphate acyltransferase [Acidobacteriota bacterium]
MYYWLVKAIFWLPVRLYFPFRVVGRERIPRRGPLVVVANHASFLDPILLGSAFPRRIHFFVLQRMYDWMRLSWFYVGMGTIPVGGADGDHQALRVALRRLRRRHVIGIFPEGSRSRDGTLGMGKLGTAFLAAKSGVPVLPACIVGAFQALPPGWRVPRPVPVEVRFGEPICIAAGSGGRLTRTDLLRFSARLQAAIADLAIAPARAAGGAGETP